jgi:hypothetical protein
MAVAMEGLASVSAGTSSAQETAKAIEAGVEKLHAKIGQLLVEPDLYEGVGVKRGVFLGLVTALFLHPGLAMLT